MSESRYAMIGYYPLEVSGHTYAVGGEGVTIDEACEHASAEDLEMYQLFPVRGAETGHHRFYRRGEDGGYERGRSREFAARLSPYAAGLIERDEKRNDGEPSATKREAEQT